MNNHYLVNLVSVGFQLNYKFSAKIWFSNTCKILFIIRKNNLEAISLKIKFNSLKPWQESILQKYNFFFSP